MVYLASVGGLGGDWIMCTEKMLSVSALVVYHHATNKTTNVKYHCGWVPWQLMSTSPADAAVVLV